MSLTEQQRTRNFCIIAHIDHGKSTLADRMLQLTHAVEERKMREQVLDSMDLERERGITIKAHTVTLRYQAADGRGYTLNLIDTPGHVDFSYEVSRSLAACEGAILVVDASQGVEAQTVANAYLASDQGLAIVPVLNKVDLQQSHPEEVKEQIEHIIGIDASNSLAVSAKTGLGVPAVLEAVVERVPPPRGDPEAPLRALVFDAQYDAYKGVRCLVRIVDGSLRPGQAIRLMAGGRQTQVESYSQHGWSCWREPTSGVPRVAWLNRPLRRGRLIWRRQSSPAHTRPWCICLTVSWSASRSRSRQDNGTWM